jgi:hypothetical protein
MAFKKLGESPNPTPDAEDRKPVSAQEPKEFEQLVKIVRTAYESGTTMDEAERHAARFLEAQLNVAAELASLDLDARMKKNGMKAARAQIYLDLCAGSEKKPSDTFLEQQVTLDRTVNLAVDLYEKADARRENLTLYLGIFKDAHVYFRGIAKGAYNG